MSAVPRYPANLGYAGLRLTADEFFNLGETEARYELIDGVVVMSPSPSRRHQIILRLILRQLELVADAAGLQLALDEDIEFGPSLVYCPDIGVYAPGRITGLPSRLTIIPDLVIEIISPGSKSLDLVTKRDDYGRCGVQEYWALDSSDGSLRRWRAQDGQLTEMSAVPTLIDKVRSEAVPSVVIDLAPIRELFVQYPRD